MYVPNEVLAAFNCRTRNVEAPPLQGCGMSYCDGTEHKPVAIDVVCAGRKVVCNDCHEWMARRFKCPFCGDIECSYDVVIEAG